MSESDAYYRRRAEDERNAADQATDKAISLIHREMAQRYRDLLGDPEPDRKSDVVESGPVAA